MIKSILITVGALAAFAVSVNAGTVTGVVSIDPANSAINKSNTIPLKGIPCRTNYIAAAIKFYRLGQGGAEHDISVRFSMVPPGPNPSGTTSKTVVAKTTIQDATLANNDSMAGCNAAWQFKLETSNGTVASAPVTATVTLTWDSSERNVGISGDKFSLYPGSSITKNLGGCCTTEHGTLQQGTLTITAYWGVIAYIWTQNEKIKIEILGPNGNVVASKTGHPSNSVFDDKFNFKFDITSCQEGQWKLRFTNVSDKAIEDIDPRAKLRQVCPPSTLSEVFVGPLPDQFAAIKTEGGCTGI